MHRLLVSQLIVLSAALVNSVSAQDLMPPHVMEQLGLTQAWARPVPAPAGSQSIADQQLFVHQESPREYVEVVMVPTTAAEPAPADAQDAAASGAAANPPSTTPTTAEKVLARIPTDQIQGNGKQIGRKEAERLASNEIRRLKRRGIEAKINVRSVPRVHLYTLATDGTLECRDAETGEPIWMVGVGNQRLPFMSLGVSEDFVTVINGANLIQVDAATGEVMVEVPTAGTPEFGAINAGDFAMIPMVNGAIQGYPLRDPTIDPFLEQVSGSALKLPVKSPGSSRTAWGTDRGYVYVMEMQGTPGLLFRLKTDGIVGGRIAAASGDRFFFGSEAGLVYGLRATRSGKVMWNQPIGEPFYNEPIIFEDNVLLRSVYGNLFCLNIDDGHLMWETPVPGINHLIGVVAGKLYATTLSGVLTIIDMNTGKREATYPQVLPNQFLVNTMTDRLYFISNSADVQCLRLDAAELPSFNTIPDANPPLQDGQEAPKAEPAKTPFGGGTNDPFGAGGADPFGGGGADPFGAGGADPFGGGNGAPMNDPFGGGADPGADPFGGNPFGG